MSKLRAWLQLFRAPNLLTVPGDPLAGFLIATGGFLYGRVWVAIVAGLLLYAAGLAMNDLADFAEDRQERPRRPLPSGAIGKGPVIAVVLVLIGCAIAMLRLYAGPLAMMSGSVLVFTIVFYNLLAKRIPVLGPLVMGTCRGLSVLLGGVVGQQPDALWSAWASSYSILEPVSGAIQYSLSDWIGAIRLQQAVVAGGFVALYIAAVTNLARHETRSTFPRLACFLPVGALLVGNLGLKFLLGTGAILLDQAPTLWLVAIVLAAMNTMPLLREPPPPLPPRIGGFIRVLLIMQAALCMVPTVPTLFHKTLDSFACAVLLLACVPASAWLGRKFYAS